MGEPEITAFCSHLAAQKHVAASTQNQALCAMVFLYTHVLKREIGERQLVWTKRPKKLPVALTREEVKRITDQISGTRWVMGNLLCGSGLCRSLQEQEGLTAKDVLHLVCAIEIKADYFLTCDERFMKKAQRLSLMTRVMNPVDYIGQE